MRGLYIPSAPVLGNISAGAGGGADLSDIDLTAQTLDSRIKYQCASNHAYYAADGTIQFAEPDIWPLEYRDGVVVGRHEPERQATNLLTHATNFGEWRAANSSVTNSDEMLFANEHAQFVTATATATYTRVYQTPALAAGDCVFTLYVKPGTTSYLHATLEDSTRQNSSHFYADLIDKTGGIISAVGSLPVVVAVREFVDGWFIVTATASLPVSSSYFVYFGAAHTAKSVAATAGDSIVVGFAQVEQSAIMTSPIHTDSASTTRAAAFASVRIYPGLSGLRITYTDGTTDTVTLPAEAGDWYQLPAPALPWSTRYIRRISYFKE
ncbi:hypothetical protein FEM41_19990 [Jejubacter calystegiae]|uniref:Uncharacterized protein n=1 Tax=Jejubacter calystegiae TaxID=2579935 RepID=A0A4P8YLQ9_9ENTR|nr:hypothetical protein [Jejubacter calystegiae]QCT21771.1 hypothetical protein FEM41_19990 [Jejubacter calystegiae]